MLETLELTLTGNAYGGESFGRDVDGRMVFVPFTLPGEVVRVRPVETHKRWARALPEKWIEPSDQRIEPRCPHFRTCGGCHYQHIPYTLQLEIKTEIVRDQLVRIGGFEDPPVRPPIPSLNPWNYRNNMRFHLTEDGNLGFVTFDGKRVFRVEECQLQTSKSRSNPPHPWCGPARVEILSSPVKIIFILTSTDINFASPPFRSSR
jgi:23S rRNA (uracil1939-C5)-methyltransferase